VKNVFQSNRNRILRNLTLVNIIISSLIIIGNSWNIVSNALSIFQKPLIPKLLFYYASFVPFIVIIFFIIIDVLSIQFLRRKQYKLQKVTLLFGLVILFLLFTIDIHDFLMYANPFQ